MNKGVIRRRGFGKGKKKEAYLVFNGSTDTIISDLVHNSRMSYEFKIRYNRWGGYSLRCSYFRGLNAESSTNISATFDPNCNVTVEELSLKTPYILSYQCQSNGNWKALLDDKQLTSGNISSYSRGTGMQVGYYDDSGSFSKLKAEVAYLKFWNASGTLTHDLVPKEVDGVCGFYNNVNGDFYPARKGSFTINYY